MTDLKLAFRTLLKTPFVTAVAVLSLALGIGANAAIFSLYEQMILQELDVPDPEGLVNFSAPGPKNGSQSCNQAGPCDDVFSYAMFRDLEREQRGFTGIAAHFSFGTNLSYRNQSSSAIGLYVSGSYFPVLRIQPALGRLLGPEDDRNVGEHFVVVLSHRYWATQLGADPGVLGQTLTVNGQPLAIVGVAPEGFNGTTIGNDPIIFVPISMRGVLSTGFTAFENRRSYWAYLFARLDQGTTVEQAGENLNGAYRAILSDVEAPLQEGMSSETLAQFRQKQIVFSDGRRGQSSFHEDVSTPIFLLMAVTGVVLLIACANIANLLLARGARRGAEVAIRSALGARRGRLIAQLLTEACLLALLGGVASLAVARVTLELILRAIPPEDGQLFVAQLSPTMALFAAVVAIGTGVLFGIYPALHATRTDLVTALKASSGQPSGARSAARFRNGLVTGQIALAMTLLVVAGLFVKSLMLLSTTDLGLDRRDLMTFRLAPVRSGYDLLRSRELFGRVEQELTRLPGVTAVTSGRIPILSGSNTNNDVSVEGFEGGPDVNQNVSTNEVGAGYFASIGIPMLAGREFTLTDDSTGARVAIVNQAFARKFNLDERETVGKMMRIGRGEDLDIQIVGLVQDAKYSSVRDEVPPQYFRPWAQAQNVGTMVFYARYSSPTDVMMTNVRTLMQRLDPNLPVDALRTLETEIAFSATGDRIVGTLAAAFAGLATLLTAVGLYGVLAYTVAQRTREIGLRMALGAGSDRVRAMVLRQVGIMTLIGAVVGMVAANFIARAASSLLYGLQGHDPWVLSSVTVLLVLVALVSAYVPALRASRVDPMKALRYE
jgi:predicted permease